jgi:hypothetical protein
VQLVERTATQPLRIDPHLGRLRLQIALRCRGLLLGVRRGPARLCPRRVRRLLQLGALPQLQLSQLLHLRLLLLLLGTAPRPRLGGIAACASGSDED